MRLGLGGGSTPPLKIAGYSLMGLGGLMMVLSLPLSLWIAVCGGAIGFLGYSLQQQR